jgi:cAMP phosphodiesterase
MAPNITSTPYHRKVNGKVPMWNEKITGLTIVSPDLRMTVKFIEGDSIHLEYLQKPYFENHAWPSYNHSSTPSCT